MPGRDAPRLKQNLLHIWHSSARFEAFVASTTILHMDDITTATLVLVLCLPHNKPRTSKLRFGLETDKPQIEPLVLLQLVTRVQYLKINILD